jgi:hypothetical protein
MIIRILWVENDIMPAIHMAISEAGYILDHAYFLSEAEEYLKTNVYDLVLIDTLMALEPEDIAAGYTALETARGTEAGLAFYRRHLKDFADMRAAVLVYSVLGNEPDIVDKFATLGLDRANVLYKVSEANVNYLSQHIDKALRAVGKRGL